MTPASQFPKFCQIQLSILAVRNSLSISVLGSSLRLPFCTSMTRPGFSQSDSFTPLCRLLGRSASGEPAATTLKMSSARPASVLYDVWTHVRLPLFKKGSVPPLIYLMTILISASGRCGGFQADAFGQRPLSRAHPPFIGPISKAARGRSHPFLKSLGNDRYLRIAAFHRDEFERHQRGRGRPVV